VTVLDLEQTDIVAWCFDETERPELWADLHGTKDLLAEVISDIDNQFAARKAEFSAATQTRLTREQFGQVNSEYLDWKRRATHVKSAVIDRLRVIRGEINAGHALNRNGIPRATDDHVERIVKLARRLHNALGEFLADIDSMPSDE
jgi:hypothetical protein